MKLKYKMSITTVVDEIIAVPLDSAGKFDGVIKINETMKDILDFLSEDRTEEELVALMLNKYNNISQSDMKEKIHEICVGLKNEGLLD